MCVYRYTWMPRNENELILARDRKYEEFATCSEVFHVLYMYKYNIYVIIAYKTEN